MYVHTLLRCCEACEFSSKLHKSPAYKALRCWTDLAKSCSNHHEDEVLRACGISYNTITATVSSLGMKRDHAGLASVGLSCGC
jgi:hypothetical protein